jgi:outer membrane protein assembly factor BamE (lipoprotein component of BamABCDE complex)
VRPAPLPMLGLFCALFALQGCALFTDQPQYRGIAVSQHELNELTPGVSTQADAQALLGPPTFQEQFAPDNWVYVSQVTKMRIGSTLGVKRQHVVVLTFDDSGVLKSIRQRDLNNAVKVTMDSAQTPVPGGHAGFVQQLIGGVGSYNPGIGASGVGAGAGGLGGASGLGGEGGENDIGGVNSDGGF